MLHLSHVQQRECLRIKRKPDDFSLTLLTIAGNTITGVIIKAGTELLWVSLHVKSGGF